MASSATNSILIAALVLSASVVHASDRSRAAELVSRGEYAEAAATFEKAAKSAPSTAAAADDLYAAARLYEDRLANPERALAIYREIEERHPHSRVSLAAARRGAELQPLIATRHDAAAFRTWRALQRTYGDLSLDELETRVVELVEEHPEWPGSSEALLWLGARGLESSELSAARRAFERARGRSSADSAAHFEATLRLAKVESLLGNPTGAIELIRSLKGPLDPSRRQVATAAIEQFERRQTREHLAIAAMSAFALALVYLSVSLISIAGSLRRALRRLIRPSGALFFAAPLWLLFVLMAAASAAGIRSAVAIIAVAGALVTWLSGAGLGASRPPTSRIFGHALAVLVATIAACYIAVHRHGLLDQIIETVRFGPDT